MDPDTRQNPHHPSHPPSHYVARSAEDLLALVAPVIGFEPTESLVMMTFGARRSFHARVDLPAPDLVRGGPETFEEHWCGTVDSLLEPAVRHRVQRVFLALYTGRDDRRRARWLLRRFREAGVEVIDVLRVHEGRWYAACGGGGVPDHGVPFDPTTHPMRVRTVLDGLVVQQDREAVVASLRTDEEAASLVAPLLADEPAPTAEVLDALLERLVGGPRPSAAEVATLVRATTVPALRDRLWVGAERATAVHLEPLWAEVLRRTPAASVPEVAALVAFTAWLAGNGALSWCAVDRAREVEPGHPRAGLVARLLERAVPPETWEERRAG